MPDAVATPGLTVPGFAAPLAAAWLLGAYFLGLYAAGKGAPLRRPIAWVNLLLWPISLPAWLLLRRR